MTDARLLGDIFHLNWGQNWNLFSFSDNCTNNAFLFSREEIRLRYIFGFLIWKQGMTAGIKKSKASLQFPENMLQASLQSGQLNTTAETEIWSLSSSNCNI